MIAALLLSLACVNSSTWPQPRCKQGHVPAGTWGPNGCVFADHMVLASNDVWQAGHTPAKIFGSYAAPGESITLTGLPVGTAVLPSNPFTADASGNWSISVSIKASLAPYTITFVGSGIGAEGKPNSFTVQDVLFGHTFLCAGQSNMAMRVGCSFGSLISNKNVEDATAYPEIRAMKNGCVVGRSLPPIHFVFLLSRVGSELTLPFYIDTRHSDHYVSSRRPTGLWQSMAGMDGNGYPAVQNFSATCWFTALHLKRDIPLFKNVPIGLVMSAVAAQTIERFMTPAALEKEGVPAANATGTSCSGQVAHTLYDTLIAPLAPFVFKTMIWYQGEANVRCNFVPAPSWEHNYYARLLPELIRSWRTLFGTNFTTLVVQLASWGTPDRTTDRRSLDAVPALRQAQYSALPLPHVGMVYPIDIGVSNSLHLFPFP